MKAMSVTELLETRWDLEGCKQTIIYEDVWRVYNGSLSAAYRSRGASEFDQHKAVRRYLHQRAHDRRQ